MVIIVYNDCKYKSSVLWYIALRSNDDNMFALNSTELFPIVHVYDITLALSKRDLIKFHVTYDVDVSYFRYSTPRFI